MTLRFIRFDEFKGEELVSSNIQQYEQSEAKLLFNITELAALDEGKVYERALSNGRRLQIVDLNRFFEEKRPTGYFGIRR